MNLNEALARNVSSFMRGRGIAQLRLEMGHAGYRVGQGTLQRLIAGDCGVRLESIQKLADFFGVSLECLLASEPDRSLIRNDYITFPLSLELRRKVDTLSRERGVPFEVALQQLLGDFADQARKVQGFDPQP